MSLPILNLLEPAKQTKSTRPRCSTCPACNGGTQLKLVWQACHSMRPAMSFFLTTESKRRKCLGKRQHVTSDQMWTPLCAKQCFFTRYLFLHSCCGSLRHTQTDTHTLFFFLSLYDVCPKLIF